MSISSFEELIALANNKETDIEKLRILQQYFLENVEYNFIYDIAQEIIMDESQSYKNFKTIFNTDAEKIGEIEKFEKKYGENFHFSNFERYQLFGALGDVIEPSNETTNIKKDYIISIAIKSPINKKGLDGENEISYQLKKAHIGMYVLRNIKVRYEDMTAQIDYVIITPVYTYYVECKNLVGNITVTDKGDFIREFTINGKKIKKGMYSPLRQVEAQREVIRKIWENNTPKIKKFFASKNFDYYRRVLVVVANQDAILNTNRAPKEIKHKVLKADALVRQIQSDLNNRKNNDYLESRKGMEELAKSYLELSSKETVNYYEYYKTKYCNNVDSSINDDLKDRLIKLRKTRSSEMKIPAYYVFTNDELDKLIEVRPKTIEELKSANILTSVKIKTHGEQIINEINK